MADGVTYKRYTSPSGKPGYLKTSGVLEDIKSIVSDAARAITPASLRNRSTTVDDAVDPDYQRKRDGQSTDSNNKY